MGVVAANFETEGKLYLSSRDFLVSPPKICLAVCDSVYWWQYSSSSPWEYWDSQFGWQRASGSTEWQVLLHIEQVCQGNLRSPFLLGSGKAAGSAFHPQSPNQMGSVVIEGTSQLNITQQMPRIKKFAGTPGLCT